MSAKVLVDKQPLQNILNYLAARPYTEVAKLMSDLQASAMEVTVQPKDDSATPKVQDNTVHHATPPSSAFTDEPESLNLEPK